MSWGLQTRFLSVKTRTIEPTSASSKTFSCQISNCAELLSVGFSNPEIVNIALLIEQFSLCTQGPI
jgi:hypothetical protein